MVNYITINLIIHQGGNNRAFLVQVFNGYARLVLCLFPIDLDLIEFSKINLYNLPHISLQGLESDDVVLTIQSFYFFLQKMNR